MKAYFVFTFFEGEIRFSTDASHILETTHCVRGEADWDGVLRILESEGFRAGLPANVFHCIYEVCHNLCTREAEIERLTEQCEKNGEYFNPADDWVDIGEEQSAIRLSWEVKP